MALTALKQQKHRCNIVCLDGTVIHCDVSNLTRGSLLFEYACAKIGIREKQYFGLKYKHHVDGKDSWLRPNLFLGKKIQQKIYSLQLRVKHWPAFPAYVKDDITRYHMVLDLKAKFINGDLVCSAPMKALLASYFVQGELGDHHPKVYEDADLRTLKFFQDQPENFVEIVSQFHMRHRGLLPPDCDMIFLDHVRRLKYYGLETYDIVDSESAPLVIAFCHSGVRIYRDGSVMNEFSWALIDKVDQDLKKKILYLHIKIPIEKTSDVIVCGFNALVKRDLKRMYRACVDQKRFFSSKEDINSISADSEVARKDFVRAQIIRPRTSTRSESSEQNGVMLHLEEEEAILISEETRVECEPSDDISEKLKDLAVNASLSDASSQTYSLIDDNVSSHHSNHDDEEAYHTIRIENPSLSEPVFMEEKFLNFPADLTMERLSTTNLNASTPEVPVNPKEISDEILQEQFIESQHESNDVFNLLENGDSLNSSEINNEVKSSLDEFRPMKTSTAGSYVIDDDIDTDTVIVETEEVTSQEIDPNTSNIVMVTQVVVTEIEASMEVSSQMENSMLSNKSTGSPLSVSVSKKTSLFV